MTVHFYWTSTHICEGASWSTPPGEISLLYWRPIGGPRLFSALWSCCLLFDTFPISIHNFILIILVSIHLRPCLACSVSALFVFMPMFVFSQCLSHYILLFCLSVFIFTFIHAWMCLIFSHVCLPVLSCIACVSACLFSFLSHECLTTHFSRMCVWLKVWF